jgi:hypothetical protein
MQGSLTEGVIVDYPVNLYFEMFCCLKFKSNLMFSIST